LSRIYREYETLRTALIESSGGRVVAFNVPDGGVAEWHDEAPSYNARLGRLLGPNILTHQVHAWALIETTRRADGQVVRQVKKWMRRADLEWLEPIEGYPWFSWTAPDGKLQYVDRNGHLVDMGLVWKDWVVEADEVEAVVVEEEAEVVPRRVFWGIRPNE
jgi:hypothetical protein